MKKFTLALTLAVAFATATAQRVCGTMEQLHRIVTEDPGIIQTREEIEEFTQNFIENGSGLNSRAVITIPVVVHVVYNTTAQNISDAQILSQLDVLNKDFRKLNSDFSNTPSAFSSLVADCEVQFCLAQRDPNGNATTGIIRKQTSTTSFSTNDAVKRSSSGGDDAWPSGSYLNLWVCNISGGILGYAQFPGGATATDGVVINYTAFGNTGTAAAPYNLGRTATHEVGHWFNLYHIWGDDGTGCTGTDNVGDTPNQGSENYGCPAFPHVSCSNGPNGDMFMNYMDYTDDACMFMFTAGQKARMQALFVSGGARASLLNSLGCQAPSGITCGTPASVTASAITQTGATLSWGAVANATSYTLQYQANGAASWTSLSTTATTTTLSGLTAGTTYSYRVQATCSSGTGSFSATGSFTTTTATTGCTDSYEANNSQSAAKAIAVNTNITALIGASTDVDWFKFSNTTTQKNIRISLSNLPFDYDVRLYKSNGTLIATSQNSGTTAEAIVYNNAAAATYYIRVYGYNGAYSAGSCYTLSAAISSTAFKLEEQEINAKAGDATYTLYPNPSAGTATLEMNFLEPVEKAEIRVFDVMGNQLRQYTFNNATGVLMAPIDLQDAPNGMYLINIATPTGTQTRRLLIAR